MYLKKRINPDSAGLGLYLNVSSEHQHAAAAIQQSKSFQNCRISMAISSQEAVEASMMKTYFTDKRDTAGRLVPQLNMLNGDK